MQEHFEQLREAALAGGPSAGQAVHSAHRALGPDAVLAERYAGHEEPKAIDMLPFGGTAIALNDHCTLDLEPLPVIGCTLGRIPVAGDLFKSMRHRPPGPLP